MRTALKIIAAISFLLWVGLTVASFVYFPLFFVGGIFLALTFTIAAVLQVTTKPAKHLPPKVIGGWYDTRYHVSYNSPREKLEAFYEEQRKKMNIKP